MNSILRNRVLTEFRVHNLQPEQIAANIGYPVQSVKRVIHPATPREIPPKEICRVLPPAPVIRQKEPTEVKKKNPVMVEAGKKAWITIRANKLKKLEDEQRAIKSS